MSERSLASSIVDAMFDNDPMSQWLGIERISDGAGISVLRMVVRREMLNGFALAHGGIAYSLADSALAFAANGHGMQAVSIETSISHVAPVKEGDVLTASAEELSLSRSTALYMVTVRNQDQKPVAYFKGTVFRTAKSWQESGRLST
jgi:acyl-CoA thioesterase